MNDPAAIERLLTTPGTWAVVGCSPDPTRDSQQIAALLQQLGHRIIPVNPECSGEILGERVQPDLAAAAGTGPIDVVDIFRRPTMAGGHVDEAVAVGAKAVWMQLGVVDAAAAQRAADAGLDVVMDRCPAIEQRRLERHGSAARRDLA